MTERRNQALSSPATYFWGPGFKFWTDNTGYSWLVFFYFMMLSADRQKAVTSGSAGSWKNDVAAVNSRWRTAIQISHCVSLCRCPIVTMRGHILQGCDSANLDAGVKYLSPLCIQQNLQRINAPYICEDVWSLSPWYMYQPWEREFPSDCLLTLSSPLVTLHNTRTSLMTHDITRWGSWTERWTHCNAQSPGAVVIVLAGREA